MKYLPSLPRRRDALLSLGVALFLAFTLRSTVAMPIRVAGEAVEPELSQGGFALVNRLAGIDAGDIVVYREGDRLFLARVAGREAGAMMLLRNREAAFRLRDDRVLGRVWLATR